MANAADLELHTFLGKVGALDHPTMVVFDLDPGAPAAIRECARVALWLRDVLDVFDLEGFPKTSGGKGLQIYVPLHRPYTYDDKKSFARAFAQRLEQDHPDGVVSRMTKEIRRGKVFVDWSQNDRHKTTVCTYSLRGRGRPTVSTPLEWDEVERAARSRAEAPLAFEASDALDRVDKLGDLFGPVLSARQSLPKELAAAGT